MSKEKDPVSIPRERFERAVRAGWPLPTETVLPGKAVERYAAAQAYYANLRALVADIDPQLEAECQHLQLRAGQCLREAMRRLYAARGPRG